MDIATIAGLVIGLAGLIFGISQYLRRRKDEKEKVRLAHEEIKTIEQEEQQEQVQSAENQYRNILRTELQEIGLAGPEFPRKYLPIHRSFVSLRLSQSWRCEKRFDKRDKDSREMAPIHGETMHLSPEQVMKKTFREYRLLLIVGDPGSGKTTLLKYYALTCLDNKHHGLGFKEKQILPLYFPLRELKFSNGRPRSLQDNLALWTGLEHQEISAADFKTWLQKSNALVLLDGLDEINDRDKRRQVCQWVKRALTNFNNARFVLTSRPTGIRKIDGVELECDHLRADIMDFSPEQQAQFLHLWFRAAYLQGLAKNASLEQQQSKEEKAAKRAQEIIEFLNKEENKGIRELAKVPMLLQIMAILWKDRDYRPGSRGALYDIALNYLLEYRDDRKRLRPLLPAEKARIILGPFARWMLETLKSDFAAKKEAHQQMQPLLKQMETPPDARSFCENLRDRAGLIADYGTDFYIFRHKSFMEFLAASQLLLDCREDQKLIQRLVTSFNQEWWEEPLRFFICKSDHTIFHRFMQAFFQSKVSRHLDANKETLLQQLVREAPLRKIDSMVQYLNSKKANTNQKRYILNCLKIIDSKESIGAVHAFLKEERADKSNLALAREILAESGAKHGFKIEERVEEIPPVTVTTTGSFRNPFEDHVEYILIPGGSYKFSVTEEMETVPDIYFCKYPVTNKRYRKFISYLEGKQKTLEENLPLGTFAEKLIQFAKPAKGYVNYLGAEPGGWWEKFRSDSDEDKRFNGDDHPVADVTWYAACAYCFWLSCLQGHENMYRLPTEVEWEWAAAGREPDGSLREYPWAKSKGKPTPELANYDENVGATTPVGRYPEGATPEGLMDMAGNVWEWMGNWYDVEKKYRALRGGSWDYRSDNLRCAARPFGSPVSLWIHYGFRVVSLCSPSHTYR